MIFYVSAQYGNRTIYQSASTSKNLFIISLFCALVTGVCGQNIRVPNCTLSKLNWSFNSLDQSPCLVSAYLSSPCSVSGDYTIPKIGPGFHYNPSPIPSICECSTVTYSLYNACAACQNATISPWTAYSENCTKTSPEGTYVLQIPPNTAVPAWAYQLVESSNRFNVTLAQLVGDKPENTTSPSSSDTNSPSMIDPSTTSTYTSPIETVSTPAATPPSETTTTPSTPSESGEGDSPGSNGSSSLSGSGKGNTAKAPVVAIIGVVVGGVIAIVM